jgi:hypothetical protein
MLSRQAGGRRSPSTAWTKTRREFPTRSPTHLAGCSRSACLPTLREVVSRRSARRRVEPRTHRVFVGVSIVYVAGFSALPFGRIRKPGGVPSGRLGASAPSPMSSREAGAPGRRKRSSEQRQPHARDWADVSARAVISGTPGPHRREWRAGPYLRRECERCAIRAYGTGAGGFGMFVAKGGPLAGCPPALFVASAAWHMRSRAVGSVVDTERGSSFSRAIYGSSDNRRRPCFRLLGPSVGLFVGAIQVSLIHPAAVRHPVTGRRRARPELWLLAASASCSRRSTRQMPRRCRSRRRLARSH